MTGLLGAGSILGTLAEWPLREAAGVGLAAVAAWVVAGAEAMLAQVLTIIDRAANPSLSATWFSGRYWVIAGLALVLTLPFLFAAAVQAIARADLAMLLRAGLVDLPLAVLAVTLCTPLIQVLLAVTDALCAVVSRSGGAGALINRAVSALAAGHGGFLLLIVAGLMLVGGLAISIELVIRAAAIYVVVLFLPLGFAAMVWPARRVWIRHMLEVLAALILSKFAMVAILSLAGAAATATVTGQSSLTAALTTGALMLLAALSPWALLRLLPFTELAAAHGPRLHGDLEEAGQRARHWAGRATGGPAGPSPLESAAVTFDTLSSLLGPRDRGGADSRTASEAMRSTGAAALLPGTDPEKGGGSGAGRGPGQGGPPHSGGLGPDSGGLGPDSGGLGPDSGGLGPDSGGPWLGDGDGGTLAPQGSAPARPGAAAGPPLGTPATPGANGLPGSGAEPSGDRGDWLDRLFSQETAGARLDLTGATDGWWTELPAEPRDRGAMTGPDGAPE
ncbi:hypothetical protein [Conexibacter sp. DBS9H8]|uniref:hypothetical protein n=1 Tax=Conexibacter sp. DBS9H8 TaxID=2937801 RepID=UPI00200D5AF0|nr:hypothetical protein [Conexibacter sp. DBS9H8]